jgi:hypothetical protein
MATRKMKRFDAGGDTGIPAQTEEESANEAALNADLPRRRMADAAMAEGAASDGPDSVQTSGSSASSDTPTPSRSVSRTPTVTPRKPAPTTASASGGRGGPTAKELTDYAASKRANPNYGNEGRAAAAESNANYGNEGKGDSKYRKQTMTPESQALEESHPEQYLMPGTGIKSVAALAKAAANRGAGGLRTITQGALEGPARQLPYDKAGTLAKQRAARAEGRDAEMALENARRSGFTPGSAAATAMRKNLGGDDWTLGMKRGGKVKGYASGGSVSSASSRADGIATKGKTRGTMVMCGGGMARGRK